MTEEAVETPAPRPATLVWIDERLAVIARWRDGAARLERVESEVPNRHRSTGHVRHDPAVRHGGGGAPQTAGEPHRLEHLARFLDAVAARLPEDEDVVFLGPGTVRDHLRTRVLDADAEHRRTRAVTSQASARLTDRQLVARLRRLSGAEPPRRAVGAYRWSDAMARRPSGEVRPPPRRVAAKPPRE